MEIEKEYHKKADYERQQLLYIELPLLVRRIILQSTEPLSASKTLVLKEIEEVKKITNAECESALEYFKKYNYWFNSLEKETTIIGTNDVIKTTLDVKEG